MNSKLLNRIEGPNLTLRLIVPEDASYVYGLRINPAFNRHLSQVQGTVDDQFRWIEAYKAREAVGQEFYFIIERKDGIRCGTVRVYNIENGRFAWGSWILDHNKTRKAGLESALLVYRAAFESLELNEARFDVRRENQHTLAFHDRFGATRTRSTDKDVFFVYRRGRYEADREEHLSAINGSSA